MAPMAQPTGEPVEDYEYVSAKLATCWPELPMTLTRWSTRSYESLPPNFSLLQNMAAGAFAGIAVRRPRKHRDTIGGRG